MRRRSEVGPPVTLDLYSWGAISAHAAARGRQAYYLEIDVEPQPSGRFVVTWDVDGYGAEVWWCELGNGHDGDGWTLDRAEAREYPLRDLALEQLRLARRSLSAHHRRPDRVSVQEVVL